MADELLHLNGRGHGEAGGLGRTGENAAQQWLRDIERRIAENLAAMRVMVAPLATAVAQAQQAIDGLTAAQASLAAQQATLADLVGNQVSVASPGFATSNNYAIQPYGAGTFVRASISFTVPSGFTKALIFATVTDNGVNSTSSTDYLTSRISTPSPSTGMNSPSTPAGQLALSTSSVSTFLTGRSSGEVLTVESRPCTQIGAWAASGSNVTILNAICIFLR